MFARKSTLMDDFAEIGCLMRARARYDSRNLDPCALPADAQFRSRENQLYRVEIHDGGTAAKATFKWSRENGSIEFQSATYEHHQQDDHRLGRHVGPRPADWPLRRGLGRSDLGCFRAWPSRSAARPNHRHRPGEAHGHDEARSRRQPRRRFERLYFASSLGSDDRECTDLNPQGTLPVQESSEGRWTHLERGVEVQFVPGGLYRSGDYWLVPARVETNDVIWPQDGDRPAALAPQGIGRSSGVAWLCGQRQSDRLHQLRLRDQTFM